MALGIGCERRNDARQQYSDDAAGNRTDVLLNGVLDTHHDVTRTTPRRR
jgi:hypothetical protein